MKNRERTFSILILSFLFLANIIAWKIVYFLNQPRFLEVDFFDVGQGEAIFIQTPKGNQILIDGGPNSKILEKLSEEIPFWDRTIDLVILTHPEEDHIIGLLEVLKKYKVENILSTGVKRDFMAYREWENLVKKKRIEIYFAKLNQEIGNSEFAIEILFPFESLKDKEIKNSNDTSVVAKLLFGQNSFLFTGDISRLVENELVEKNINLESNILKISHHGSKNSNSEEFIAKVSPQLAIISVGAKNDLEPDCDNKERNTYGHPNCEVLEILKKFGITIFRTDKEGDIKIISDGKKYDFSNF